jgi:hypothetical protein
MLYYNNLFILLFSQVACELLWRKKSSPGEIHCWVYQTCKEQLPPMLLKLLSKIQKEMILPNLFCEISITLIPKQGKDESYTLTFLMNIDAKILNKMFANWKQPHIQKIIHHDQVGFILIPVNQ